MTGKGGGDVEKRFSTGTIFYADREGNEYPTKCEARAVRTLACEIPADLPLQHIVAAFKAEGMEINEDQLKIITPEGDASKRFVLLPHAQLSELGSQKILASHGLHT